MARAIHNDFLHNFRFAISFDGGEPLGFARVEITPIRELFGSGMVTTRAALTPLLAKVLNSKKTMTMEVSVYTLADDIRDPSMVFVLHGVRPQACRSNHIIFDARGAEILEVAPTFDYTRLELRKGDGSLFRPKVEPRSCGDHTVFM